MSPLVTMASNFYGDDNSEPEACSMCGVGSHMLVFVRVYDLLVGICADCASELNKAHAFAQSRRLARIDRSAR
jgi:hypothetical protein